MEKLKQYLTELYKTEIKTSGEGDEMKLNQTQRNAIRSFIIDAIYEDLKEMGFDVYRVDKGIALQYDNEELGGLGFILTPTMCGLDYDFEFEAEEYQNKLKAKAEKVLAKAAKAKKA